MKLSQLLNTVEQIYYAEHVNVIVGLARHVIWELRRLAGVFPVELRLSSSRLRVEYPCGVGALVNCLGVYDYNNMNLIKLLLMSKVESAKEGVFFDIGANIGSYTLVASEVPGAIVSFEPHPKAFAELQKNLTLNGRSNVRAINAAISDQNGVILLTDGTELSTNKVVSQREPDKNTIEVDCMTLDEACERLRVSPTVVKIDVEGHEQEILDGFSNGIQTVDVVVIEGGEREEVRNHPTLAEFEGPWYSHFNSRSFRREPQRRREDPVFIRTTAISHLADLLFTFQPN